MNTPIMWDRWRQNFPTKDRRQVYSINRLLKKFRYLGTVVVATLFYHIPCQNSQEQQHEWIFLCYLISPLTPPNICLTAYAFTTVARFTSGSTQSLYDLYPNLYILYHHWNSRIRYCSDFIPFILRLWFILITFKLFRRFVFYLLTYFGSYQ